MYYRWWDTRELAFPTSRFSIETAYHRATQIGISDEVTITNWLINTEYTGYISHIWWKIYSPWHEITSTLLIVTIHYILRESVIVVLTPSQQFISYIMVRKGYISIRWWCLLCTRPTLSWIFIVLANWKNSLQVDMLLHMYTDTLFWFRNNQSLLLLLSAACYAEKQQIPIS
jgi:hypothetical protein